MSWHNVLPPSRPDTWQLLIIQKKLFHLPKESKIAILGSTIEFRNLLFENGFFNVFLFEKNKDYYKSLDSFKIFESEEKIIWGNWLDTINNFKNHFSLILSDLTIGNIPYEMRDEFYKSISGALTNEGLFIDRILSHPIENEKLSELIFKYSKLPINLRTINDFSSEVLFCSELLEIKEVVDSSYFYLYLNKITNNNTIRKFIELAHLITPEDCIWWYGKNWNEISPVYFKYLNVIEDISEPDNSVYRKRAKLLIAKKK